MKIGEMLKYSEFATPVIAKEKYYFESYMFKIYIKKLMLMAFYT